jgi:hypothetical protein
MTVSRDRLLRMLSDGRWHSESELGPTPYKQGIEAWIRLLRLCGYTIAERTRNDVVEYRLVLDAPAEE